MIKYLFLITMTFNLAYADRVLRSHTKVLSKVNKEEKQILKEIILTKILQYGHIVLDKNGRIESMTFATGYNQLSD